MPCRGVLEGLNVSVDSCASSSNAHFSSSLHPYTAQQQRHIRGMLDVAYDLFVTEVATHRQLSLKQVRHHQHIGPKRCMYEGCLLSFTFSFARAGGRVCSPDAN